MMTAQMQMNDFRLIARDEGQQLTPSDTVDMHKAFTGKIKKWFAKKLNGPKIVVTHHAPVINPKTKYVNRPLSPAFNSLDMIELIEKHQPVLWVYVSVHILALRHMSFRLFVTSFQSSLILLRAAFSSSSVCSSSLRR
ncbi:MAG: hypothetical protein JKY25_01475 [Robiginitomaculum sp.]|nr:hypothetical protein [Robiginitomaculum sp.]